jgi:hypothetical protein
MTHTEGPWWACPPDADSDHWEVEDGYGHTATVYGDGEPAAANARLIAAAPDLLTALIRMRDEFLSYADCPSKCDAVSMAFQAIEKAGGE